MILVNYHPFWMRACERSSFLRGGTDHPAVHRRQLITLGLVHDCWGRYFPIEPWEVLSVTRFHWNGNLEVRLTPDADGVDRVGYISANDPWLIECYSPHGELVRTITAEDFRNHRHEH